MSTPELVLRLIVCALGVWLLFVGMDHWHEFRGVYPIMIAVAGAVVLVGAWIP